MNEVSKTKPNDFYRCLKSLCEFCLKVDIKITSFPFVKIGDVTSSLCEKYRMFAEVYATTDIMVLLHRNCLIPSENPFGVEMGIVNVPML